MLVFPSNFSNQLKPNFIYLTLRGFTESIKAHYSKLILDPSIYISQAKLIKLRYIAIFTYTYDPLANYPWLLYALFSSHLP